MGLYINGQLSDMPYHNNKLHNAYFDSKLVWDNHLQFQFYSDQSTTTKAQGSVTPKMTNAAATLSYSLDQGVTWTQWTSGAINSDGTKPIYFKGTGGGPFVHSGSSLSQAWELSTWCEASGDIKYLLTEDMVAGAFAYMFSGQDYLIRAPRLSPTKLSNYCYAQMFKDCSYLKNFPLLPATTLAQFCYANMFNGCQEVINLSLYRLPSMDLTGAYGCYSGMFQNCSYLINPPELPATTLSYQCYYNMFNKCTNINSPPALPATTLEDGCYRGMFKDCQSLISTPQLPALTLASQCYYEMFYNCSNISTVTLPAPVAVSQCYEKMLFGCSMLSQISVEITTWANLGSSWVYGVAQNGDFYCPPSLPEERGDDRIPIGWNRYNI